MDNYFDKVYELVSLIPKGKVATYGMISSILGNPRNARVVGWAMRAAPEHMHIPCHRVVNKTGTLSPSYVFGHSDVQRALLELEGITFKADGKINMKEHLWKGIVTTDILP